MKPRRSLLACDWFAPRRILFAALCSLALLSLFPSASADEHAANPVVLDLNLHGVVEPILATYIEEGLADAERRQAALVLITMDTPGGLSDSMQEIIKHILASRVPVAVYVAPTGARGASAGFFILLAADIAAMAPGTHTGAASQVIAIGGWQLQVDETMKRKILNDALAFLRSYTEKRGRNTTLAETAVTDAKAFTDKEALEGKLIDVVAPTTDDLLRQLDGRQITRFDGSKTKLSLSNARLAPFELSARQKFLARIVEPDIFFVLLILGVLGLYTEFTHPGVVAPGVVGSICMVLALYAMHLLPVNLAGVFLIVLALALFILEAKFTSHGVLAAGGIVSMLLGAMFLIRSPLTAGGVSLGVALAVTLPCLETANRARRNGRCAGDRCHAASRRRGRHDPRSRRTLARHIRSACARRQARPRSKNRWLEALRRTGSLAARHRALRFSRPNKNNALD
jgi:membrane-bound serine protease (ClpP class)